MIYVLALKANHKWHLWQVADSPILFSICYLIALKALARYLNIPVTSVENVCYLHSLQMEISDMRNKI